MVSTELLSSLRELSRADKLYVMQVLISELAQQETDLIKPDRFLQLAKEEDALKKEPGEYGKS